MTAQPCANCNKTSNLANITQIMLVNVIVSENIEIEDNGATQVDDYAVAVLCCTMFLIVLVFLWHQQRKIVTRFSTALSAEGKRRSTIRSQNFFDNIDFSTVDNEDESRSQVRTQSSPIPTVRSGQSRSADRNVHSRSAEGRDRSKIGQWQSNFSRVTEKKQHVSCGEPSIDAVSE